MEESCAPFAPSELMVADISVQESFMGGCGR